MLKRTRILYQVNKPLKYIPPSERAVIEHEKLAKDSRRKNLVGKIVQYGVFTLVGGSILMYLWQPWNPYSKEVSKELRKGLWDERDGKDDHLMALKHYQNALKAAKREGMDQLSLEYTGIVLKIAEMYQNLKMNDNLIKTYFNLSTFIFENLLHNTISKENPERDLLIERDLTVITRWAMLLQDLKPENWMMDVNNELRDRIAYIENKELQEKLPWILNETKQIDTIELIDVWSASRKEFLSNGAKSGWIESNVKSDEAKDFLNCWDIFRDFKSKKWPNWMESYLRLRDFYAMFLMRVGNFPLSIQILQSNLLWSIVSGLTDTVNEKTQISNLASAWFQLAQNSNKKEANKAYKNSKQIYEKLISVVGPNDPILPITFYSLGVLSLQINDIKSAERNFSSARKLAVELDQIQIIDKIDDEVLSTLAK